MNFPNRKDQSTVSAASVNVIQQAKTMPMHPTRLEYSCWVTHPIAIANSTIILFTIVSTIIGAVIVYWTGSKVIIHSCQLSFRKTAHNPLDYNTDPRSVAIGDFNNDSWLDFVVTNRAVNNISVFLGSINGTFSRPTTYPTGSYSQPEKVAVADLNNDQRLDLVIAYFGINSIGIFLGRGDGTFVNYTTVSTNAARPKWIHIAHLDNDTSVDLVTADYGTDSITLFSGDGTGNFSYRRQHSTGFDSSPVSITSGDLNNDDHLDLVVANSGTNNVGIFFGKGDGEFSDQRVLSTGIDSCPHSVVINHLDNDKLLDIASANYGTSNVGVFQNLGNGTFSEQTTYMLENASPYFVGTADINQDEQADLIVINRGTNNIGILLKRSNGIFSTSAMFVTGSVSSISAATSDINKDGCIDVIVVNNDTNSITISIDKSRDFYYAARYSLARTITNNAAELDKVENRVRVRRQNVHETCSEDPSYRVPGERFSMPSGDFNNDGHLDVLVMRFTAADLVLFLGYGNGSFSQRTIYQMDENSFISAQVGDFNDDAYLDIVLLYNRFETIGTLVDVLLADGNDSFTKHVTYRIDCNWDAVMTTADFNKDNLSDIVVGDFCGIISVFLAIGNGLFARPMNYSIESWIDSIAVDDFNNDTLLDIIVASSSSDDIHVFFGYGNGSFSNKTIQTLVDELKSIVIGDLDNDNIPDIVATTGSYDITVNILLGSGNGSFHHETAFFIGLASEYISLGDLNQDNRLDVTVFHRFDNNMQLFVRNDNGSFRYYRNCSTGNAPVYGIVTDFNQDGRSDILVGNYVSYDISLFIFALIDFTSRDISSGLSDASRLHLITTNDFNNDSILDMIVVDDTTKSIALLLGDGSGSFKQRTIVQLERNSNLQAMAIGDFNRDNQLDLAIANAAIENINMLLGDGRGALIHQNNDGYSLDHSPTFIVTDDFNHDGYFEVAVAYSTSDDIQILSSYDSGTLADQITSSIGFNPIRMITGDFNNDQILDCCTITLDQQIGVLFGDGNGSFVNQTFYSTDSLPTLVAVGHLNNDSHLDIVISNYSSSKLWILFGYGNGSFHRQKTYSIGVPPTAIVVADLNNDTFSDVILLIEDTNSVRVRILINYGNGSFTKPRSLSLSLHSRLNSVAVSDVNNDMFMDIIVLGYTNPINVFLGYGNGSFRVSMKISIWPWWSFITSGDFNNDSQLDLVLVGDFEKLYVLLGLGNGSFVEHSHYSVGCSPTYAAVADFNNDTYLDVVTVNFRGDDITVLLGDGTGSFTSLAKYRTIPSPEYAIIGDFNNDARMDILIYSSTSNTFSLLLGKLNHVFKRQSTLRTGLLSPPQALATGHFNNDTHPDIVFLNSHTNSLGVFLSLANGSFSPPILSLTDSSPSLIAVGHLNNDAHLDVVIVYSNRSSISIHLGKGNGSFINHTTCLIGDHTQPKSVSIADFDNDAIFDIILLDFDLSDVLVFTGYGNGSFTAARKTKIGHGTRPFLMSVGDYNNDQKLDFAVGNYDANNLQIYLQTC